MYWHPKNPFIAGIAFLREYARSPRAIGAICPSSRTLALKMAEKINISGSGLVIELGAGTGCVTEALLMRGVSPARILVIERAQAFVDILHNRFPGLNVLRGDARHLSSYLATGVRIDSIVSSLPFASLDSSTAVQIVSEIKRVIGHGNLIQYTYILGGPHFLEKCGFVRASAITVWRNLPPATALELMLE